MEKSSWPQKISEIPPKQQRSVWKGSATSLPQSPRVLLVPYELRLAVLWRRWKCFLCLQVIPHLELEGLNGIRVFSHVQLPYSLFPFPTTYCNHEDTCNFETMKTCTLEKQNASSNQSMNVFLHFVLTGRLPAFRVRGALIFFLFWNWSCSNMVCCRCSKVTAFQGALPRPSEGLRLETSALEAEAPGSNSSFYLKDKHEPRICTELTRSSVLLGNANDFSYGIDSCTWVGRNTVVQVAEMERRLGYRWAVWKVANECQRRASMAWQENMPEWLSLPTMATMDNILLLVVEASYHHNESWLHEHANQYVATCWIRLSEAEGFQSSFSLARLIYAAFLDALVVGRWAANQASGQLSGLPGFEHATMVVLSAAIIKKDKTLVARSAGLLGQLLLSSWLCGCCLVMGTPHCFYLTKDNRVRG